MPTFFFDQCKTAATADSVSGSDMSFGQLLNIELFIQLQVLEEDSSVSVSGVHTASMGLFAGNG